MIVNIVKKIFGTSNDRVVKQYFKTVTEINNIEEDIKKLSENELLGQREKLFEIFSASNNKDDIMVEAFATVREASIRSIGLRHHDVQLIGGMALVEGNIAEMGTGEGKTLVATLAVYLNAIMDKKSHVVTVNDYLAKRDSDEMGVVYNLLGVSVGCNVTGLEISDKHEIYAKDVVYGTNSEFGFDYLKDNLVNSLSDKVQNGLEFCIVDEVDSILIDEARTPLIISGAVEDTEEMYLAVNAMVSTLVDSDVIVSEKDKNAQLSEEGFLKVEGEVVKNGLLESGDLYGMDGIVLMHYINAALKAHFIFKKDIDYLIKDSEILIIDEFTGRSMDGRRWSNGLHQAIEAKENVSINSENETVASITYQNYFRMYETLSGMTGTADTEAGEFLDIYGLNVVCIPSNKPVVREDENDKMYADIKGKYKAVVEDIKETHKKGQPVLVGTPSVEVSEKISLMLKQDKIKHNVLNAKNHKHEATIIEDAGNVNAITIATNMAGRGTDIKLGGADGHGRGKVLEYGGLRVIGVERQDNRRLDNQLRGRSGRQGDAGSSCFYVSPDDQLMRIFGGDRIKNLINRMGTEGEAVEHPLLNKGVTNAQRKIEAHNYDIRKNVIKYDDVANDQRKHVYEIRNKILVMPEEDIDNYINNISEDCINSILAQTNWDDLDKSDIKEEVFNKLGIKVDQVEDVNNTVIEEFRKMNMITNELSGGNAFEYKKNKMLSSLDIEWVTHLRRASEIREGINLRGYAQKDPIKEFQKESFDSFKFLLNNFSDRCMGLVIELYTEAMEIVKKNDFEKSVGRK
jgi:preprotein translocase subunit SecA